MLLLASFGRHQTCSSVSDSTHVRNRGQYCSSSFQRENSMNSAVTVFGGMAGIITFSFEFTGKSKSEPEGHEGDLNVTELQRFFPTALQPRYCTSRIRAADELSQMHPQ